MLRLTSVPRRLRYRRVLASMVFFQNFRTCPSLCPHVRPFTRRNFVPCFQKLPHLQRFVFTCTSFYRKKLISMFPGAAKRPPALAEWLSRLHVQPVIQRACRCVVCLQHMSILSNMPELSETQPKHIVRLQHPHNCNAKKCSACFRFVSAPRSRQEARADGTTRIGIELAPASTGTPANNRPPRTGCGKRDRTRVETTTDASRARGGAADSLLLVPSICTLAPAACLHCLL